VDHPVYKPVYIFRQSGQKMIFKKKHCPEQKQSSQLNSMLGVGLVLFVAISGGVVAWQVSCAVHADSGNPLGELLISFGPAALFASGKGMILPLNGVPPELEAFLSGKINVFDPHFVPAAPTGPHIFGDYPDTFTLTHWLLFYSVGWVWRMFGISINALHVLSGFMGGLTAVALYLLFRLGMGRFFSCLGALFTLLLPPFLLVMPTLRDFSKAPFILLFLFFAGKLLTTRQHKVWFIATAFCIALLLGTGYGFRQDIMICLPIALGTLLFAPLFGGYHFMTRLFAMGLMLVLFFLLATPVLRGMRHESGSVTTHTLFQGLSREAEQTMGFGDASYDLLLTPSDPEVHATVNAHARMRGITSPMSLYLSPAYAQAGRQLFKEWALTFPADLFARGLSSIETVMKLSSLTLKSVHYQGLGQLFGDCRWLSWHNLYARDIEPFGLLVVVVALFVLGLRSQYLVLATLLILGYFMAYPNLLFQIRHAFHLAFIIPFASLFILENVLLSLFHVLRSKIHKIRVLDNIMIRRVSLSLIKTAGILLVLVSGCIVVLVLLRNIQTSNVQNMMEPYRNATLVPLETVPEEEGERCTIKPARTLPGLEESWNLATGDASTSYLALSFEQTTFAFPVQIQYQPKQGPYMSRRFIVPPGTGGASTALYYIPVYELADFTPADFHVTKNRFGNSPLANLLVYPLGTNKFKGIGLRKDTSHLLKNMYYVKNHSALPWLLYLSLPMNEKDFRPFKRLYLEKAVRTLPLEYQYWRTKDSEQVVIGYFSLLSQYPVYQSYIERIKKLIPLMEDPLKRADAWFNLGGYEPDSSGQYAGFLADIAKYLQDREELAQAEQVYRQAITLAPGDGWHQVHLADVLAAQGKLEVAKEQYESVLRKSPESPYCAKKLEELLKKMAAEEN
jgi:hypothetical protein